jgi:hypothetical protein
MDDFEYYEDELNETLYEELEVKKLFDEELEVKRAIFFSSTRSSLYRKVIAQPKGLEQWMMIVGKLSRSSDGRRIQLTDHSKKVIQVLVDYYNETEGLEELKEIGVQAPEHVDSVVSWISGALTSKQLSAITFKYALKKFRREYGCR